MKNAMIFMALALFLAACTPPSTPAPRPTSAQTATPSTPTPPLVVLSFTPAPTHTPAPTPTPLSTFVFLLPSSTAGPAHVLDCQLISQSVPNDTHFNPKERFDISWKITNTGAADWYPGVIEFIFVGGAKLATSQAVHLQTRVVSGDTVSLNVDMVAPKNSTKYTTFWALRRGTEAFCRVSLTIYVP